MKRRIGDSLALGLVLLLLSLFYRTGPSNVEPRPYVGGGCGNGGVCGVVANPVGGLTGGFANRGFPLPAVSASTDEDTPANYYKSLNVLNTLGDYALYAVISFGLISLFFNLRKSRPKNTPAKK